VLERLCELVDLLMEDDHKATSLLEHANFELAELAEMKENLEYQQVRRLH
jgi:hypothetical protein